MDALERHAQHLPDVAEGCTACLKRSGRGDGRTYTLTADAVFDQTRNCSMTVEVTVPHDMRDK